MVSGEDTSTNKKFSCVLPIIYTIMVLIVLKAAKSLMRKNHFAQVAARKEKPQIHAGAV
jgi:hypothetical protein